MTAKEYLSEIKKIDTKIKNKGIELKQAKSIGLMTDGLSAEIRLLYERKQKIIKNIEELPEAEYDVLHKVYVQYMTLQEVAAERGISYSLAATIHGRALKRLENYISK